MRIARGESEISVGRRSLARERRGACTNGWTEQWSFIGYSAQGRKRIPLGFFPLKVVCRKSSAHAARRLDVNHKSSGFARNFFAMRFLADNAVFGWVKSIVLQNKRIWWHPFPPK